MKVLIIGSGGREHALAWCCRRSSLCTDLTCAPGNGGTAGIARNVAININDHDEVLRFIDQNRIELVIIGPEYPLVKGLSDVLSDKGIKVFGPSAKAARIEGSKAFAKDLMKKVGVDTAEYGSFKDLTDARRYIDTHEAPFVVKASGLAAGKGVLICHSTADALAAVQGMLQRDAFGVAGREIVIEEFLQGKEVSLFAFVDGEDYLLLPPSRDHKRAFDNDQGPNTGGMGAYSPLDDLSDSEIDYLAGSIFPPVIKELAGIGSPYRGLLYAGVMLTERGYRVLEFNCRFGDPETQVVLPLLNIDPLEVMTEISNGNLAGWMKRNGYKAHGWRKLAGNNHAVTVVIAAKGYPNGYDKGMPIESLPEESEDVIIFHAGTRLNNNQLLTSGGRVLAVTALGFDHQEAAAKAYEAVSQVNFRNMSFRKDIGK